MYSFQIFPWAAKRLLELTRAASYRHEVLEQILDLILLRSVCLLQSIRLQLSGPEKKILVPQTLWDKLYISLEGRHWFRTLLLSVSHLQWHASTLILLLTFKLLFMSAPRLHKALSKLSGKYWLCSKKLIISGQTDAQRRRMVKWQKRWPNRASTLSTVHPAWWLTL